MFWKRIEIYSCQHLEEYKSYNALLELICATESVTVSRMKLMLAALPKYVHFVHHSFAFKKTVESFGLYGIVDDTEAKAHL
jgi:hypothetical protein